MKRRPTMPGALYSFAPSAAPDAPVRFEDMLSMVQGRRLARLEMRKLARYDGILKGPLFDREQVVLGSLETFLAKCLVVRDDINNALRGVRVAPIDQGQDDEADQADEPGEAPRG